MTPTTTKTGALVASGALIVVLGWVESHTPAQLSFGGFYFLPVALAAWTGGLRWGALAALGTAVDWVLADYSNFPAYDRPWLRGWTGVNHLLSFLFLAFLVDRFHRLFQAQQEVSRELAEALSHVRALEHILPVCAWCKRVRDDQGYWQQVEEYLGSHNLISHGVCPECKTKVQGELEEFKSGGNRAEPDPYSWD